MTESLSPPPDAGDTGGSEPEQELPELVPGRGRRLRDYALERLRKSRGLQISAVLAVLSYGALPFLVMYPDTENPRVPPFTAALMVLMSLASWTLLFWWYPVFQDTKRVLGDSPRGQIITRTLETVAIGCVVVVHGLMAYIIVRAGVTS